MSDINEHESITKKESNYLVLSSDGHAGADIYGYKPYLERRWHDDFDMWASQYSDPWKDTDTRTEGLKIGISSATTDLNWDSTKRLECLESEGICGEVLFPNTAPPFYPTNVLAAPSPRSRDDYERRWAGLRAHNRWLVDFCSEAPGRRAGIAQILLFDVDDAVEEIRWAKEAGLKGGVLLPADHVENLFSLYRPKYEPVWATCADLGVPIHKHSTGSGEPYSPEAGIGAQAVAVFEGRFFWTRCLPHLILSGVFERHPNLRLVLTETGLAWIPEFLNDLDALYLVARNHGSLVGTLAGEACLALPRTPTEYFASNCVLGASLLTPSEVTMRHEIGVEKIMFGSDFPHGEGTYPYTRESLRLVFSGISSAEVRKMLATNAAELYEFDVMKLQAWADSHGPTVDEVATPLDRLPAFPGETLCPVFSGEAGDRNLKSQRLMMMAR